MKLINLSGEIRRSVKKYKLFKKIVGKQFPHFTEIRWHIKFYIIELFLENKEKISEFLREACILDLGVRNILDKEEVNALELLFDTLKPLALITKLVQSKSSLIAAYAPILFAIKDHIGSLRGKSDIEKREFDINTPLQKVERYINRIRSNYPTVGLAALFHIDGTTITDELQTDPLRELAELATR